MKGAETWSWTDLHLFTSWWYGRTEREIEEDDGFVQLAKSSTGLAQNSSTRAKEAKSYFNEAKFYKK